jgi:hypothetical protein
MRWLKGSMVKGSASQLPLRDVWHESLVGEHVAVVSFLGMIATYARWCSSKDSAKEAPIAVIQALAAC